MWHTGKSELPAHAAGWVFSMVGILKNYENHNRIIGIFLTAIIRSIRSFYPSLPPANEVCEGYVFTPVCHSVHRGLVCPSACWYTPPQTRGRHPPWSRPPRADTPCEQTTPPHMHAGSIFNKLGDHMGNLLRCDVVVLIPHYCCDRWNACFEIARKKPLNSKILPKMICFLIIVNENLLYIL